MSDENIGVKGTFLDLYSLPYIRVGYKHEELSLTLFSAAWIIDKFFHIRSCGLHAGGLGRLEPCDGLSADGVDSQPGSMELSVSLPEGFLKAFNDSDVNIDMEFDPEGEGSFSSAAITLDDRVLESSFNGKGITSWYLQSQKTV